MSGRACLRYVGLALAQGRGKAQRIRLRRSETRVSDGQVARRLRAAGGPSLDPGQAGVRSRRPTQKTVSCTEESGRGPVARLRQDRSGGPSMAFDLRCNFGGVPYRQWVSMTRTPCSFRVPTLLRSGRGISCIIGPLVVIASSRGVGPEILRSAQDDRRETAAIVTFCGDS